MQRAGYPQSLLYFRLRKVFKMLVNPCTNKELLDMPRVSIPYHHAVSHNILAVAKKFNVQVVFTNAYRLSCLTPFEYARSQCSINHRNKYVNCVTNIVYHIPLACGFCYVGQTGRCLNVRLSEHHRNIGCATATSELSKHLAECRDCSADLHSTEVLGSERNGAKRLLLELCQIKGRGNCVSIPSVMPPPPLLRFLGLKGP